MGQKRRDGRGGRRRPGARAAAAAALAITGGAAQAACPGDLTFSVSAPPRIDYPPGARSAVAEEMTLTLRGSAPGDDGCEIHAYAPGGRTLSAPGGARHLAFDILLPDGAAAPRPQAPLPSSLLVRLEEGEAVDETLKLRIELAPDQFVGSGDYSAAVPLDFYEETDGDFTFLDDVVGAAHADVGQIATLAVGGVLGGGQTISYGEMRAGERREVVVTALSNDPFVLKATSVNKGRMAHVADRSDRGFVPYKAELGGAPLHLEKSGGSTSGGKPRAATTISGAPMSLSFTLGAVVGKRPRA
ncbi:MAG: hypothetical protein AAFR16_09305, partial [Pseudomonadota bacterium]